MDGYALQQLQKVGETEAALLTTILLMHLMRREVMIMMIYATTPLSKDVAGSQQMKRDRNSIGGKVNVHLIYACGSSEHVNFLDYSISNDDYLPGYGLTIHRISSSVIL